VIRGSNLVIKKIIKLFLFVLPQRLRTLFLHFWLKTIKKQSNSDSRFKLGDQKNNKTIFIRPAAKTIDT
jgi:hypothetical protein